MKCSKCGTQNDEGLEICVNCGNTLENEELIVDQKSINDSNNNVDQQIVEQPINQINKEENKMDSTKKMGDLNFVKYIISSIVKPFQNFKEEEEKLCDTKTSLILGGIVAVAMMIINLLSSMISVIFAKSFDVSSYKYKTTIDFSNLADLDYLSLIFKNLFIYVAIIAVIALVYYLAALVVKKSANYIKFLSITTTSIIPFAITSLIISPILGKIWAPLSIIVTVAGAVYAILIFIYLIKEEVNFDKKDKEIYFNLVCMTILGSAGYYVFINLLTSGITKQLSDYLNF